MSSSRWNILSILIFSSLVSLCLSQTRNHNPNCKFEELPRNFDLESYLQFNEEFHIHGRYFANVSNPNHLITFNVKQKSYLRFYTSQHDSDVDLFLYTGKLTSIDNINPIATSTLHLFHEETLQHEVEKGDYTLNIHYFMSYVDLYTPTECETFYFEAAIVPSVTANSRLAKESGKENLPNWKIPSPLKTDAFVKISGYADADSSENPFLYRVDLAHRELPRIIKQYEFEIEGGHQKKWSLEATLGAEFLYGGSLEILLFDHSKSEDTLVLDCLNQHTCIAGHRMKINEHVLKASLSPGKYILAIFDRSNERTRDLDNPILFWN